MIRAKHFAAPQIEKTIDRLSSALLSIKASILHSPKNISILEKIVDIFRMQLQFDEPAFSKL